MNKVVTVDFELDYDDLCRVSFSKNFVRFGTEVNGTLSDEVVFPIEVAYQMYNSAEMIEHMEEYHRRRSEVDKTKGPGQIWYSDD